MEQNEVVLMKITRKQLKKLILKEFLRNDNNELDFNLNDILYPSDGNIDPPEINPRRGGGGRNCEPGSARYERIFDKVRKKEGGACLILWSR